MLTPLTYKLFTEDRLFEIKLLSHTIFLHKENVKPDSGRTLRILGGAKSRLKAGH